MLKKRGRFELRLKLFLPLAFLVIILFSLSSQIDSNYHLYQLAGSTRTVVKEASLVNPSECSFEDDFLIPIYKSNSSSHHDGKAKVTVVSEFYNASSVKRAMTQNIKDNDLSATRFIYLVGGSRNMQYQQLQSVLNVSFPAMKFLNVYYAPGGVTYRHLFGAAMMYPQPFMIHNADIGIGNVSKILDACHHSFNNSAVVGSRVDVLEEGATCQKYFDWSSFDAYMTNREGLDCNFLNNMRFPPFYWGAENVVASQLPKQSIANLCPHWTFAHYHAAKALDRVHRIRINADVNSWTVKPNNAQILSAICNIEKLMAGSAYQP